MRHADSVMEELIRGLPRLVATLGTVGAPALGELLITEDGVRALLVAARQRVAVACDPGVQTGYVLAGSADGVVVPVASLLIGRRPVKRGDVALPPTAADHVRAVDALRDLCDGWIEGPSTMACEDWFAGPNPNTTRDIAEQYYFAKAAAQAHGLTFRSTMHSTWKKTYLGRGNLSSAAALRGYAGRGFTAHPGVARWDPSGSMELCDDAAALGVATWWLESEAT